jgi:hypothetical protein
MIGLRQRPGPYTSLAITSVLAGMVLLVTRAATHTPGRHAESGLCTIPHTGPAPCGGR